MKYLGLMILFALLSSCSGVSITKEECQSRDWAGLGVKHGAKGKNYINEFSTACSEHGVSLSDEDILNYTTAWKDSFNLRFCNERSAYNQGLNLKEYGELENCINKSGLTNAYTQGKRRGVIVDQIRSLKQKVREHEARIMTLSENVNKNSKQIDELKKINFELNKEIRMLERELSKIPQTF
jgi:hypothetical protein